MRGVKINCYSESQYLHGSFPCGVPTLTTLLKGFFPRTRGRLVKISVDRIHVKAIYMNHVQTGCREGGKVKKQMVL